MIVLGFAFPVIAYGHGGGIAQITNRPMGEYIISVWSSPSPPTVGKFHLTVALTTEANPNQPSLNQPVTVTVRSLSAESLPSITTVATHDKSVNRLMYEADVDLPEIGRWQVDVIAGNAPEPVSFEIAVKQGKTTSWLPLLLGGGAVIVVGFFLAKRRKR